MALVLTLECHQVVLLQDRRRLRSKAQGLHLPIFQNSLPCFIAFPATRTTIFNPFLYSCIYPEPSAQFCDLPEINNRHLKYRNVHLLTLAAYALKKGSNSARSFCCISCLVISYKEAFVGSNLMLGPAMIF